MLTTVGSIDLKMTFVHFLRLSCFTSGAENAHNIAQVTSGRRFALTVAFSCDADAAIADPTGDRAVAKEAVPE